jgi:hypothetical protein
MPGKNPLNCVTHHYACECREAAFRTVVDAANAYVKERHNPAPDVFMRLHLLQKLSLALEAFKEESTHAG